MLLSGCITIETDGKKAEPKKKKKVEKENKTSEKESKSTDSKRIAYL